MADPLPSHGSSNQEESLSQASSVGVADGKLSSETSSECSSIQSSMVARNTSDLSYDISSASEEDSVGDLKDSDSKDITRSNNRRKSSDPCLSFDEECRELLAALSLKNSVDGDDEGDADKAGDIDDKEGDLPDVSPVQLPKLKKEKPRLETVAKWIKDGICQNIVVLSGAGVSCAAGIPDFRTPGTGL